jgi:hypothetical protein
MVSRNAFKQVAKTWKQVSMTMKELRQAKCDREKVLKVKLQYLKQAQTAHQWLSALTKQRCQGKD